MSDGLRPEMVAIWKMIHGLPNRAAVWRDLKAIEADYQQVLADIDYDIRERLYWDDASRRPGPGFYLIG